ncbi:MAG: nucleotidyltransferase family protein [Clostridia bacterium]|nr:nucleotidyltransferase family protein [Clostridia bacterium]
MESFDSVKSALRDYCKRNSFPYEKFLSENDLIWPLAEKDLTLRAFQSAMRMTQRGKNGFILQCMKELRDICIRTGIPHVFLKGLAIGEESYPAPELRTTNDVDILVSIRDVRRLASELLRNGFSFEEAAPAKGDPFARIQNSHHHLRAMEKEYELNGRRRSVPVEIHVYPFARGFEFLGRTQTDLIYTDQVISGKRQVFIEGDSFYVPSVTDSFYILSMHMLSHMCLDTILYLYVCKPFQNQKVAGQLLDIALFLTKHYDRIDTSHLIHTAAEQGRLDEIRFVFDLLGNICGIRLDTGEGNGNEGHTRTPIAAVCRLLAKIDPAEYVLYDHLKTRMDDILRERLLQRKDKNECRWLSFKKADDHLLIRIDEDTPTGIYCIDVYFPGKSPGITCKEFVVITSAEEISLAADDGYRLLWAPETYGHCSEDEIGRCYMPIETVKRNDGKKHVFSIENSRIGGCSFAESTISISQRETINPFLSKKFV